MIAIIENENNDSEWVKMDRVNNGYLVYHYVNSEVKRKCLYDDFFNAVDTMKEWISYFD